MTTPSILRLPMFAAGHLLLMTGLAVAETIPCDDPSPNKVSGALPKPARFEITDRLPNLLPAPKVEAWKVVPLDTKAGGAWVVSGDLDGDGAVEIVSAQNKMWWTGPHDKGGVCIHYASSISAQKLDGTPLWQLGDPADGRRELSHDVACQVYDWDGDGKNEVVAIGKDGLMIVEGATGKVLHTFPVPEGASDCVLAADLTGYGHPRDFVLKDRYWQMWGMSAEGEILWASDRYSGTEGRWHLGHRPLLVDLNGDGRDDIFAGFFMYDAAGKNLWEATRCNPRDVIFVHMDSNALLRRGGADPADWRFAFTYCSGLGLGLINGKGEIQKEVLGSHYEAISSGNVFPNAPGPHLLVDIDHLPAGRARVELFDAELNLMGRIHLDYGRYHKLMDWDGDGWDDIVIAEHGMIYNHKGEKIAAFDLHGQRGHIVQAGDFTGDGIRDLLIVGSKMDKVFIFRNTRGKREAGIPLGTGPNYSNY